MTQKAHDLHETQNIMIPRSSVAEATDNHSGNVSITLTDIGSFHEDALSRKLHPHLPDETLKAIWRKKRRIDRITTLAGRYLVLQLLRSKGYPDTYFNRIRNDTYGKPHIPGGPHFNVSHSGTMVAAVFSESQRVGVDLEHIRPLDLEDFRSCMQSHEWDRLVLSENPLKAFFDLWTRKEAILKADGRGISIPLGKVDTGPGEVGGIAAQWHVRRIEIRGDYSCHVAGENAASLSDLEYIPPAQLENPS